MVLTANGDEIRPGQASRRESDLDRQSPPTQGSPRTPHRIDGAGASVPGSSFFSGVGTSFFSGADILLFLRLLILLGRGLGLLLLCVSRRPRFSLGLLCSAPPLVSCGRCLLDPLRRNVPEWKGLGVLEKMRNRLTLLTQTNDHSRRRREVHSVVEPIDDVQVIFAQVQARANMRLTRVDERSAGLAIDQKQIAVVRPQVEFGRADRRQSASLGRRRPARFSRRTDRGGSGNPLCSPRRCLRQRRAAPARSASRMETSSTILDSQQVERVEVVIGRRNQQHPSAVARQSFADRTTRREPVQGSTLVRHTRVSLAVTRAETRSHAGVGSGRVDIGPPVCQFQAGCGTVTICSFPFSSFRLRSNPKSMPEVKPTMARSSSQAGGARRDRAQIVLPDAPSRFLVEREEIVGIGDHDRV